MLAFLRQFPHRALASFVRLTSDVPVHIDESFTSLPMVTVGSRKQATRNASSGATVGGAPWTAPPTAVWHEAAFPSEQLYRPHHCLIAAFARAWVAGRRIPTADRTAVWPGLRVGSTGAGSWTQTVSVENRDAFQPSRCAVVQSQVAQISVVESIVTLKHVSEHESLHL